MALRTKVLDNIKQHEPSHQPEKWMAELSISSVHLKEGNTFARSVWLHLVDKVSNHLAKVIATCDLFSGLNHLKSSEVAWVRKFYIRMMNGIDVSTVAATKGSFQ